MKSAKILVLFFTAVFMLGCFNACSGKKVTRVDSGEVIDLSGNWNDSDSQFVSKAMISDSLKYQWFTNFKAANGRNPKVIVGSVLNKTEEHLSTETFVKDLERELINSGKVIFVASADRRGEISAEKEYQAENAKDPKAKKQESAADFILQGQINTIFDSDGKNELKYYQVELEIINIETHEKVWMGQHKIKKVISKKKYKA